MTYNYDQNTDCRNTMVVLAQQKHFIENIQKRPSGCKSREKKPAVSELSGSSLCTRIGWVLQRFPNFLASGRGSLPFPSRPYPSLRPSSLSFRPFWLSFGGII